MDLKSKVEDCLGADVGQSRRSGLFYGGNGIFWIGYSDMLADIRWRVVLFSWGFRRDGGGKVELERRIRDGIFHSR